MLQAQTRPGGSPSEALVSALCVTRGEPEFVRNAVQQAQRQTIPLQLVMVGPKARIERGLKGEDTSNLDVVVVDEPRNASLGELRNLAVGVATCPYVIQWDDDDWFDPSRAEWMAKQVSECSEPAAVILNCWVMYHRRRRRFYISKNFPCEGSVAARREVLLNLYPPFQRGEDTYAMRKLINRHRFITVFCPSLYTYVWHGQNAWGEKHFDGLVAEEMVHPPVYARERAEGVD